MMSGLFRKFAPANIGLSNTGTGSPFRSKKSEKDGESDADLTPLREMLLRAGPVRADGSDKFYGMENFGNTCYCNSIVQALYYSVPFREAITQYPPAYRPDSHRRLVVSPSFRTSNAATAEQKRLLSGNEALKPRTAFNAGQPMSPPTMLMQDKPDSPEYKKKRAIATGPVLEMTAEHSNTYGMAVDPFTALKDVFEALVAAPSRIGVVSPQHFLDVFKKDNDMFRAAMHQDAHEFYGLVLNHVITAIDDFERREKRLKANDFQTSKTGGFDRGTMPSPGTPGTSWLHEIFEGVMTSETRCLTCETASQRDETFLDLSIDLENNSSVTACLRKFSAEEMLRDTEKFHCDNCGSLQEAEKRMKIKKLPQILTLCLKRFKYTDDLQRLQKVFDTVVYPYHLRMFNTTADAEDPDRLYELYAVVVHIGANAYHGHYISVIKTKDRGWLLFDDEMVEPVDKHYVRNFFGDRPGQACAYLLFYQATTIEAVRREQEAEGKDVDVATSQDLEHAPPINGVHPSSTSKAVDQPGTPHEERSDFLSTSPLTTTPTVPMAPRPPPASEKPSPIRSPSSPGFIGINGEHENHDPTWRGRKDSKDAENTTDSTNHERDRDDEKKKEKDKEKENHPRSLFGSLSRNARGSKSTSARKSFNFMGGGSRNVSSSSGTTTSTTNPTIPSYHGTATTMNGSAKATGEFAMLRERDVSRTMTGGGGGGGAGGGGGGAGGIGMTHSNVERVKTKDRFSFSNLGRKKSRDLLSGS